VKKTLVVNLFAGPGASKFTTAAGLFYQLKKAGVDCELVTEYAKELVYLNDFDTLKHQAYVTVKQYHRQKKAEGKVDVIVTDSPVIIGNLYPGIGCTPSFLQWTLEIFNESHNLNIFLERNSVVHPYKAYGRIQNEEEAKDRDVACLSLLTENNIPFERVPVSQDTVEVILSKIMTKL